MTECSGSELLVAETESEQRTPPALVREPGSLPVHDVDAPIAAFELKFSLGDLPLFAKQFSVVRCPLALGDILERKLPIVLSRRPPEGASGIVVRHVPRDLDVAATLHKLGYITYCMQSYAHFYIELTGDFETYTHKFSSKTRSTMKRRIKAFTESCGGKLDWRRYVSPAEMAEFRTAALPLSKRTYQARLFDCGLPESDAFVEEIATAAAQDAARAFTLYAGDRIAAYLYLRVREGVVTYDYQGYDPDLSGSSPGTILFWHALRSLFEERRFRYFDFTEGSSAQKQMFSTHHVDCANYLALRPTLANRTWIALHRTLQGSSTGVGRLLDHLGLRARIRQVIRRIGAD